MKKKPQTALNFWKYHQMLNCMIADNLIENPNYYEELGMPENLADEEKDSQEATKTLQQ